MTPSAPHNAVNGDRGWRGVNMRLDPSQLGPGWMSEAINARFRNGVPETRLGSVTMAWLNKITSGDVGPWGTVHGVGEFRDPTTFTEYVLIAADGNVYACRENNAPYQLALPVGETISDRVTFVQCFNVVLMLRGFDADPLVMDDINLGFKVVVQSAEAAGAGLLTIPRALRGVFAANRVFLLREDDTVVASDVLDYTGYTLFNDFRVNQGDADKGVAIVAFGQASIIVFKERSVYRIDNVYGNLEAITFSLVTNRYGCLAADSVVNCGSDVLWLSQEGVASLTLTEQNEIQASQGALAGKNRMFSEDIGPLIERANGNYSQNAFGAVWNDRYYLGLPIDQAETLGPELVSGNYLAGSNTYEVDNLVAGQTYRWTMGANETQLDNGSETLTASGVFTAQGTSIGMIGTGAGVAVTASLRKVLRGANDVLAHYDFQNTAWGGYDMADAVTFQYLFTASYVGKRRLFVMTGDGYVRLWEEGFADRLSQPYIDVTVTAVPSATNTLAINAGTTVTAYATDNNNDGGGNRWGIGATPSIATAAANLWTSVVAAVETGGFAPYVVSGAWSKPSTQAVKLSAGVRFYASNGILPTITVTGTWSTIDYVTEQAVELRLVTRGYRREDDELAGVGRVNFDVQTWDPETTVTLLADGVNEETTLIDGRTRDRTKYYRPFNRPDYDTSNANDDFMVAHRQDYSIEPTGSSYTFTPPVTSPVNGDLHQAVRYPAKIPGPFRRVLRFQIDNTNGRLRLQNVDLEYSRRGRGLAIRN